MADTLTRERARYEATKRNQATMAQVETLLVREGQKVIGSARDLGKQELGGFLRRAVPGLIDRYGKVNATSAMKYYDEQRLAWRLNNQRTSTSASAGQRRAETKLLNRKSERFAAAKLRSQIYVAKLPEFKAVDLADPIVGYGMARFAEDGFDAMRDQVSAAMTRAVASYNRDTILYNAGLDDAVVGVQRVAEPNACAFCATVAFSSGTWNARESRVSSYAVDFHNNCRCSIETLYVGDQPLRPDYYDQLEQDYVDAAESVGTRSATDLFAEMRKQSGRK